MQGKITFSIKGKNVYVIVENGNIVNHEIEENESLFSKISYFNNNDSDMTEKEYNQFYNENTHLIELLADLEVLF